MMTLLIFGVFLLTMFLSVPIALSLMIGGLVPMLALNIDLVVVPQKFYNAMVN